LLMVVNGLGTVNIFVIKRCDCVIIEYISK